MLLLKTERLPEGADIAYEIKLDGFRSIAFKTGGKVYLRSRNDNDFVPPVSVDSKSASGHAGRDRYRRRGGGPR